MVDWVTIDFETANYSGSSICSVGMAAVKDGEIKGRFTSFVRPADGDGFASFNMGLHGITPEMVREAPTWSETLTGILAFADGRPMVAHNAAFDFGRLHENHYDVA
ncbi:exonuclease domain-containing protein [Streptomyces polygonati]|uniref:Exonuclease domain-containing protein n=1 Tax=Streptomyces polygonati TaxID=1617087 RepID=A0ABV8HU02_9ACTN